MFSCFAALIMVYVRYPLSYNSEALRRMRVSVRKRVRSGRMVIWLPHVLFDFFVPIPIISFWTGSHYHEVIKIDVGVLLHTLGCQILVVLLKRWSQRTTVARP